MFIWVFPGGSDGKESACQAGDPGSNSLKFHQHDVQKKLIACLLFSDIAAVEEWLVRITLQYGLNIYTTEGTLLDTVRGKCQEVKVKQKLYYSFNKFCKLWYAVLC